MDVMTIEEKKTLHMKIKHLGEGKVKYGYEPRRVKAL